jgi:uridine kinase
MKFPWNREKQAPVVIGICGRSCSGKGVIDAIAGANHEAIHINADIYFTNTTLVPTKDTSVGNMEIVFVGPTWLKL